MIDETLLKKHSIGKDGFVWWLGQVCPSKTWKDNIPFLPKPDPAKEGLPGFADRVKVSILGYHTTDTDKLKNEELPWAYCLKPTTAGGNMGGAGESINLQGGEWVFGFFLDGEDGQQPVIIGVLAKSDQQDFRLELPKTRFAPFTGYTNRQPEPLTNQKRDENVGKSSSGSVEETGDGGVKVESKLVNEQVRKEGDPLKTVGKDVDTAKEIDDATGDMQNADPSDCNSPMDIIDMDLKRLSKLKTFVQKHKNIYVDKEQNIIGDEDMAREQKRAADRAAAANKILNTKAEAAALEALSEASSEMATSTPLSAVPKAMDALDKSTQKLIGQFNSIIDALPSEMQGMVSGAMNKIVSQPPCVTEGYTAGVMAKSLGSIDKVMNSAMSDVNNVLAMAGNAQSLAKQGLGAAKALAGGDIGGALGGLGGLGGMSSMLSGGLNSLGGISIPLDGLPKFQTSYKKLIVGEEPLPCVPKSFNSLQGGLPLPEGLTSFGSMIEGVSSQMAGMDQLVSGISDLTGNNSVFSSLTDLSKNGLSDLGGIGGVDDALKKASNLSSYAKFPGTTGNSIMQSAMSLMQKGQSISAAEFAAETIFPGGGAFITEAFGNQLKGKRKKGGSCSSGPTLNGPPMVDVWGGEGNGVLANAVVGPNGNILAVQVKNCGKGFREAPYVAITDSSGRGQGAVARAVLNGELLNVDGEGGPVGTTCIKEIEVLEPGSGYMSKSDGSVGGNGVTFAKKDETVFKDKDGNYYKADSDTMVSLPPGSTVWFPPGTEIQLPTSAIRSDGEPIVQDKKKGKIKSLQVVVKKGYKGFAKVTDGSRDGAGPILSLVDAVTDRKVSNLLERQTGIWLNVTDELQGNTDIMELFKEAQLRSVEGTPVEQFGKVGTASEAGGKGESTTLLGQSYKTLDPWRAGLKEGTRLKFRGVFNHDAEMTPEQYKDPYNIQKNSYRYFIFEYEVEVYKTGLGYAYAGGLDAVKDTWYKLININYVTGSEDFKNGEVVTKRLRDKSGRLYEMYIRVCTYDDDRITVYGGGLQSNSEIVEVTRTKLPNGEYVEESRKTFKQAETLSYELPCGGEFSTPPPTEPVEQPAPRLPIRIKGGNIISTGSGYRLDDEILVDGVPADFDVAAGGRIIIFRPPAMTVQDYPDIEINSQFGAGADLEVNLEVGDPFDYPEMDPMEMVEVVDCVGKNIFIVDN